jgi:hypothetical protein
LPFRPGLVMVMVMVMEEIKGDVHKGGFVVMHR